MGLFNLFKKENQPSPAQETYLSARDYFEKGEFVECLRQLSWGFDKDVDYKPLYELAVMALSNLDAVDEQQLFNAVLIDNNNPEAYRQLGNYYYQQQHYDLAKVFFDKTLKLDPANDEIKHDLAICYARRFQIGEAVKLLKTADPHDFWNIYFLNKCKMLDKQTFGVSESIAGMKNYLDSYPDQAAILQARLKVEELSETLARLQSVTNLENHIRDWHYIQYGGVILDYFESDDYVAGGRWVASWGSKESVKSLAVKLKLFIEKMSISFAAVCALGDRDSEIVGRIIAMELDTDFRFYDPTLPNENCLIVSSDTKYFQDYEKINNIENGQVIFAANHSWLENDMVTPDIIGFMTQSYSFPWNGGGFQMTDPDSGEFEVLPEDDRSSEVIAHDIFNTKCPDEDMDEDLSFYFEHKDHLKGLGRLAGSNRYNFTIESPVPGSYFA